MNSAGTMTELIAEVETRLRESGSLEPRLEAELIVAHLAGYTRAALYRDLRQPSRIDRAKLEALLARRLRREPLAHILGHREFYGLDFIVSSAVLVPRPETELVVETALEIAGGLDRSHLFIADVGTGSGCVAIALAQRLPLATVIASDVSLEALEIARVNRERHSLQDRVMLVRCNLLAPVWQLPRIVTANLPYIATGLIDELEPEVARYEPRLALDGGTDGFDLHRALLAQVDGLLAGTQARVDLIMEISPEQTMLIGDALDTLTCRVDWSVRKDLAGLDRVAHIALADRRAP